MKLDPYHAYPLNITMKLYLHHGYYKMNPFYAYIAIITIHEIVIC